MKEDPRGNPSSPDFDPRYNPRFMEYFRQIDLWHGYAKMINNGAIEDQPDIHLSRLYVEPSFSETRIPPEKPVDQWPETTSLIDVMRKHRNVVLLGDPGSGKSTIVSWLAYQFSREDGNPYKDEFGWLIPIPIILRDLTTTADFGWEELLEASCQNAPLNVLCEDEVSRLLSHNRAILLFDGLDELSAMRSRESLTIAVLGLEAKFGPDNVRWIGTSRLLGYEDAPLLTHDAAIPVPTIPDERMPSRYRFSVLLENFTRRRKVHLAAIDVIAQTWVQRINSRNGKNWDIYDWAQDQSVQHAFSQGDVPYTILPIFEAPSYFLAPFRDKQIEDFVAKWHRVRDQNEQRAWVSARDLIESIHQRKDDLEQLARTPQLLTMMALVHKVETELPHGRAKLYQAVGRAYLHTIPKLRNFPVPFPVDQARQWLAYVGFHLQNLRKPVVDSPLMEAVVQEERGSAIVVSLENLELLVRAAMSKAGHDPDMAPEFLKFVARRSGLLLPRGEGQFAFIHLSFQEYFAAEYLASIASSQILPRRSLRASADSPQVPPMAKAWDQLMRLQTWSETVRLMFQIVPPTDAEDLLTMGLPDAPSPDWYTIEQKFRVIAEVLCDPYSNLSPEARAQLAVDWIVAENKVLESGIGLTSHLAINLAYETSMSDDGTNSVARQSSWKNWVKPALRSVTRCRNNFASDSRGVQVFSQLQDVRHLMWSSPVDDEALETLGSLGGLENLSLEIASGANASRLLALENLCTLSISLPGPNAGIQFSSLRELSTLSVHYWDPPELELRLLSGIKRLYLWLCLVESIDWLEGFQRLEALSLAGALISDLAPLKFIPQLEWLNLDEVPAQEFSPLSSLINLKSLSLDNTRIHDLEPLKELLNLEGLGLRGTLIEEVDPFASLTKLRTLRMSETKINDVGPLGGLESLTSIDISRTGVRDLRPIEALPNLKAIFWEGSPVKHFGKLLERSDVKLIPDPPK